MILSLRRTHTSIEMPDDTMVYTGHGDPTTIGFEKQGNPVLTVRDNIIRVKGPDAFRQE